MVGPCRQSSRQPRNPPTRRQGGSHCIPTPLPSYCRSSENSWMRPCPKRRPLSAQRQTSEPARRHQPKQASSFASRSIISVTVDMERDRQSRPLRSAYPKHAGLAWIYRRRRRAKHPPRPGSAPRGITRVATEHPRSKLRRPNGRGLPGKLCSGKARGSHQRNRCHDKRALLLHDVHPLKNLQRRAAVLELALCTRASSDRRVAPLLTRRSSIIGFMGRIPRCARFIAPPFPVGCSCTTSRRVC